MSLADRHPNRLCFQVAVFNNVHSGTETNEPDLLKLSIGLDACKWAEAFKMMSAPLNQTLSENPDVVRRLLRRRGRKSIKKAKLSSKFKNKHPKFNHSRCGIAETEKFISTEENRWESFPEPGQQAMTQSTAPFRGSALRGGKRKT